MNANIPEEVFSIGILNRDYHARLLLNLNKYAAIAGIPVDFIWSRLSQFCTDEDMAWVKQMKAGTNHGLIYTGNPKVPVEDKMMAITGACLRNFIDARMMTVQEVLSSLKDDSMPSATLILVPNFCLSKEDSSNVSSWQSAALLGWLYQRMARDLKTVLYVGDFKTLEAAYGTAMKKHLEAHYAVL